MRLIRYIRDVPAALKGGVVALGNFDGLHRGHQAVIKTARSIANEKGVASAVMTFEPHPRAFFQPNQASFRLSPLRAKCRQMRIMGVDFLYMQRFDAAFSSHTADEFVDAFLIKGLDVSHVVIGYDYVFGTKRGGNAAFLKQRGQLAGFGVTAVEEFRIDATAQVSSTAIREFLSEGACQAAARLLGRYWEIAGRVQHGDKRGRQLGFPTANVPLGEHHHPREGVYAVRAGIDRGGETVWYDAVANFGRRPTFNKSDVLLEVHLFDFDEDLYHRNLRVGLIEFIRPEQKFDGLEALKAQLDQDCISARAILKQRAFPENPHPYVALGE
ncbi:MAG: bifunctional riboflavin kinase/FAD synthetase [Rhodospirillaceae bacterium]